MEKIGLVAAAVLATLAAWNATKRAWLAWQKALKSPEEG